MNRNVKDEIHKLDYKYDSNYDLLAVKVKRQYKYGKTIEMEEGVLLDFDCDNVPVALEILDASKRFNLPKYSLEELICLNINLTVNTELIILSVKLCVIIQNKEESKNLDYLTSNLTRIPSLETELVSL